MDALAALSEQQNLSRSNKKLLKVLVNSGVALYGKGLDRGDELEADHLGVVIVARAGYEPFGLPGLLLALDGLGDDNTRLGLLNSTHPTFRDRLEALDELAPGYFPGLRGCGTTPTRCCSHPVDRREPRFRFLRR